MRRKGSFPFPSYAEALFSQVLVSRKPIQGVWEHPKAPKKVPLVTQGPQVAGEQPLEVSERKQVLQSLGRFVDEQGDGGAQFPGGSIQKSADAQRLKKKDIVSTHPIEVVEPITEDCQIIFFGERPKDFSEENPKGDLLSKMIQAMKLKEGSYGRVFIEKDNELAKAQWHETVLKCDGLEKMIVVSLGALATNTIMGKRERLSKVHGKEFQVLFEGEKGECVLQVFPVFHPDILQINPNMKRSAWLDLQKVMEKLA